MLDGRYVSQEIFNDWVQTALDVPRLDSATSSFNGYSVRVPSTSYPSFPEFVARGLRSGEYIIARRYAGKREHILKVPKPRKYEDSMPKEQGEPKEMPTPSDGHVARLEAALNVAEEGLVKLSEKDWGYSDPAMEASTRAHEAASYLARMRSIRAGGDGDK